MEGGMANGVKMLETVTRCLRFLSFVSFKRYRRLNGCLSNLKIEPDSVFRQS